VDFHSGAGQTVAMVGRSGAGKIFELHLWEPTEHGKQKRKNNLDVGSLVGPNSSNISELL